MDGIKKIDEKQKVEPTKHQPQQLPQLPIQFPPMWSEVTYGGIRVASSYEDMQTLVSWLKYMVDMEKARRPSYLG